MKSYLYVNIWNDYNYPAKDSESYIEVGNYKYSHKVLMELLTMVYDFIKKQPAGRYGRAEFDPILERHPSMPKKYTLSPHIPFRKLSHSKRELLLKDLEGSCITHGKKNINFLSES